MHQPLHYNCYPHPTHTHARYSSSSCYTQNNIFTKSFSLASSNNKEIAWPVAILIAVESDPSRVCRIENCLYKYNSNTSNNILLSAHLSTSCLISTSGAIVRRSDQLLMAAWLMLGFNLRSLYNASNPSMTFTTSYKNKCDSPKKYIKSLLTKLSSEDINTQNPSALRH